MRRIRARDDTATPKRVASAAAVVDVFKIADTEAPTGGILTWDESDIEIDSAGLFTVNGADDRLIDCELDGVYRVSVHTEGYDRLTFTILGKVFDYVTPGNHTVGDGSPEDGASYTNLHGIEAGDQIQMIIYDDDVSGGAVTFAAEWLASHDAVAE